MRVVKAHSGFPARRRPAAGGILSRQGASGFPAPALGARQWAGSRQGAQRFPCSLGRSGHLQLLSEPAVVGNGVGQSV